MPIIFIPIYWLKSIWPLKPEMWCVSHNCRWNKLFLFKINVLFSFNRSHLFYILKNFRRQNFVLILIDKAAFNLIYTYKLWPIGLDKVWCYWTYCNWWFFFLSRLHLNRGAIKTMGLNCCILWYVIRYVVGHVINHVTKFFLYAIMWCFLFPKYLVLNFLSCFLSCLNNITKYKLAYSLYSNLISLWCFIHIQIY
jgi:hypothetical protein